MKHPLPRVLWYAIMALSNPSRYILEEEIKQENLDMFVFIFCKVQTLFGFYFAFALILKDKVREMGIKDDSLYIFIDSYLRKLRDEENQTESPTNQGNLENNAS